MSDKESWICSSCGRNRTESEERPDLECLACGEKLWERKNDESTGDPPE